MLLEEARQDACGRLGRDHVGVRERDRALYESATRWWPVRRTLRESMRVSYETFQRGSSQHGKALRASMVSAAALSCSRSAERAHRTA